MKLPGGDQAIVDIAKLRDYCLSPGHARGVTRLVYSLPLLGSHQWTPSSCERRYFAPPAKMTRLLATSRNMAHGTLSRSKSIGNIAGDNSQRLDCPPRRNRSPDKLLCIIGLGTVCLKSSCYRWLLSSRTSPRRACGAA